MYALAGVLVSQGLGMWLFGRESLVRMTLAMISAGAIGNLAATVTTWNLVPTSKAVRAEVVRA